jgi:hypothetical protein
MLSLATLLYALLSSRAHAEIRIVTPPGLESVEGNSRAPAASHGFRVQELYPASWFLSLLPKGGAWLTGFRSRADVSQQNSVTVHYNDMRLTASTTQRNTISTIFADNVGNNAIKVIDGTLSISYEVGSAKPNPFSAIWEFTTPFYYDPDEGNLLLDYISHSGLNGAVTDDAAAIGIALSNAGGPSDRVAGVVFTDRIITQFVFAVPDPDYNRNGVSDAADYDVWRQTFGDMVELGSGADGNLNGVIDTADYVLWRNALGHTAVGRSSAAKISEVVPEPATHALIIVAAMLTGIFRRHRCI